MSSSLGPVFDIVAPYLKGKVKRSGSDNVITLCPFHDDHTASFWLNINNGLWLCFGCGERGSLHKFLRKVGLSYDAVDDAMEPVNIQIALFRRKEKYRREAKFFSDPYGGDTILPEALLGVYEYKPNDLVEAGFDPKLLRSLDIGFDRRLNRIIYPLRDLYGNLVGLSGRATQPGDEPRYKVYRGGHRDDKGKYIPGDFGENFDEEYRDFKVDSHRFLWNAENVYPSVLIDQRGWDPIVVTEGFKACMWTVQNGFPTTVALTGASISEDQRNLIIRMSGNPIVLFLDNDQPGRKATLREGKQLRKSVNELWVATYPKGYEDASPDDLDLRQLRRAIYGSEEWSKWLHMTR